MKIHFYITFCQQIWNPACEGVVDLSRFAVGPSILGGVDVGEGGATDLKQRSRGVNCGARRVSVPDMVDNAVGGPSQLRSCILFARWVPRNGTGRHSWSDADAILAPALTMPTLERAAPLAGALLAI